MARGSAVQERSLLSVADYTGGQNTRVSKFLIKDNQAQLSENWFFGLGGVLKLRPGAERKTSPTMGAGGVLGGVRYYPASGSAQLLADHGTTWRMSTDDGVTMTTLTLPSGVTLSAFADAYYVQIRDLIYRADGVNQPLKYDGTTVTKWGIAAPTTAGSGTQVSVAGATGSVSADFDIANPVGWGAMALALKPAGSAPPTFVAVSAIAASTGVDVTVTLPAHQADDILLLAVLVRDTDDSITVTGWTAITGTPFSRGASARYWLFWKRAASSSETNPLVDKSTATGDTYAAVAVYRGALAAGDPWELGTAVTGTADPASVTGLTVATDQALVIFALAGEDDNNAEVIVTATNPAAFTEHYQESATGSGGMILFAESGQAGSGSLSTLATYKWKMTYRTATAESNGGPEGSVTLTGTHNKIDLSGLSDPPAGSGATSKRLYRTKANGAIYYFEEEVALGTTTATLDVADSALGAEMPEDKNTPPADLLFVGLFKNRAIGVTASNRRQFIVSDLFEPEAFPPSNAFTVPFPEGDKINGIMSRGDLFFLWGTSTIFAMVGDSPFNFTIRQTYADEGFVSQRGVIEVENVVIGPTRFGFQAFDGANARIISLEIETDLRSQVDQTKIGKISGVYDIENRMGRWALPVTGPEGRKEFCFDLFRRGWTTTTRKIAMYIPFYGSPDRGQLFSGDPDDGYIWRENVADFGDNGANIVAKYRTKAFDLKVPRQMKRFWHAWFDFKPGTGLLAIEAQGDSGAVIETFSPNVSGESAVYGSAEYSVDSYGGPTILSWDEGYTFDPAANDDFLAKHVDFLVQYTGKDSFEFYRMDHEVEIEQWLRKT